MLADEPENVAALMERADLFTDEKNFELAIADLKTAAKLKPNDKAVMSRLATRCSRQAKQKKHRRSRKPRESKHNCRRATARRELSERRKRSKQQTSSDPVIARKALEKLLEKNPRSAMLLGRLGASYRTDDPARSLEFYRELRRFSPTLLNTRSVTLPRWSRRVASPEAAGSCDRL